MQTLNHDLYSVGHLDTGKLINILETPDENIIIRKQQYKWEMMSQHLLLKY